MEKRVRDSKGRFIIGHPVTLEIRKKISEKGKGRMAWNKGKHLSEETKKRISISRRGIRASPGTEFKKGHIPWNKGLNVCINSGRTHFKKGVHASPNTEFKKGEHHSIKTEFQNLSKEKFQEIKEKAWKSLHSRPTSLEQDFINFIKKNNLKFEYVGNGKFFIGRKNPDFINRDKKQIIEIFGNYWHSPEDEHIKKEFYIKHGWNCKVIWENDLRKIMDSGSSCWLKEK